MSVLEIGGVPVTELAKQYQTPLYVYDQQVIEDILTTFVSQFTSKSFPTKIIYASKAFQTVGLLNLLTEYGIGLDVVSGGELYTATKSKLPISDVYFHGNNKGIEELEYAFHVGVNHIVVDNYMELELLDALSKKHQKKINVLLRLNVGIEAYTHAYIITSHVDSKFGFSFDSKEYDSCVSLLDNHPFLTLEGFHSHIGSQIFDMTAWYASIDKLVSYLKTINRPLVLNIGGGFGVKYVDQDQPLPLEDVLKGLISHVEATTAREGVQLKQLMIEPGRSIVAAAGSTLYTLGFQKQTPEKTYYFVDGGMSDNLRPSLYQAKYSCDLANHMDLPKDKTVTIAGKCCESGDILIEDCQLPTAKPGDLLIVYTTGAYGHSMSNNYNKNVIPAVVFVKDGNSRLVARRQSYEDLLTLDVID